MRILHGLTGAAGQPYSISRAQRALGADADCVLLGSSKFGYKADLSLDVGMDEQKSLTDFLADRHNDYDIFHLYYRPYFFFDSKSVVFPTGLDLLSLRAAGKKVIFNYRGSEVRTAEKFRSFSPYNYVEENPSHIFSKFPTENVEISMRYVKAVSNRVLVPDPELQSYVPHSEVVPRAIDLTKWENVGVTSRSKPLVVHAPTRSIVKGTRWIMEAISKLRADGLEFEFQLIQNMSNDAAADIYRKADIVIDQLRIGWYGVLAVECMALGKPVVAYIRDDLVKHLAEDEPVINANPSDITEVLRHLITDSQARIAAGVRARKYAEKTHDSRIIASQLLEIYKKEMRDPSPVDLSACLEYLLEQRDVTQNYHRRRNFLGNFMGKYKRWLGRKLIARLYRKRTW